MNHDHRQARFSWSAFELLIAVVAAAVLVAILHGRLRVGVDFTDEAFYAAMPHTFALGNRPFVNELALQQTAAVLLIPFVSLYRLLNGGSEGLVLAFRYGFLALAGLSAVCVFLLARTFCRRSLAIMAAAAPFVFSAPSIPSLSYNTLGGYLLLCGVCLAAYGVIVRGRGSLAAAGVLLVMAAVAYPPLAVAGAVAIAAVLYLGGREPALRRSGRFLLYSWLLSVVAAFSLFVSFGWANLAAVLEYMFSHGVHAGGQSKMAMIGEQLRTDAPYTGVILVLACASAASAVVLSESRRWIGVALALAFMACFTPDDTNWRITAYVAVFTVLIIGAVVAAATWRSGTARVVTLTMLLPGMLAGLVTAWTSSNGLPNAAIGSLSAVIATLLLAGGMAASRGRSALLVAGLGFMTCVAHSTANIVYGDFPRSRLTELVRLGPYRGIRTTPERALFVAEVMDDVARYSRPGQKVIFYDQFPAGYLFLESRPDIVTTWSPLTGAYPGVDRSRYSRYWAEPQHRPDVVFEMKSAAARAQNEAAFFDDPLRHLFWTDGYETRKEGESYTVFSKCDRCRTHVIEAESMTGTGPSAWRFRKGAFSKGVAVHSKANGAELRGSIPQFRPGPYSVKLLFRRSRVRNRQVVVSMGSHRRSVSFAQTTDSPFQHAIVHFPFVDSEGFSVTSALRAAESRTGILDQVGLTTAAEFGPDAAACSYCVAGPLVQTPVSWEPESVVLPRYEIAKERSRSAWVSIRAAQYSGGGAVVTRGRRASLRGSVPHLKGGSYSVAASVWDYGAGSPSRFIVRLGGIERIFEVKPGSRGLQWVSRTFEGVAGNGIEIRSLEPGPIALLIDRVSISPFDAGDDDGSS